MLHELHCRVLEAFPHCNDTSTRGDAGFAPHMSLGQVSGPPPDMAQLAALWPGGRWTVKHVHLMARSDFHDPFHVRRVVALGGGDECKSSAGEAVDWVYTARSYRNWRNVATDETSDEVPDGCVHGGAGRE
jgi:hypothetical protein